MNPKLLLVCLIFFISLTNQRVLLSDPDDESNSQSEKTVYESHKSNHFNNHLRRYFLELDVSVIHDAHNAMYENYKEIEPDMTIQSSTKAYSYVEQEEKRKRYEDLEKSSETPITLMEASPAFPECHSTIKFMVEKDPKFLMLFPTSKLFVPNPNPTQVMFFEFEVPRHSELDIRKEILLSLSISDLPSILEYYHTCYRDVPDSDPNKPTKRFYYLFAELCQQKILPYVRNLVSKKNASLKDILKQFVLPATYANIQVREEGFLKLNHSLSSMFICFENEIKVGDFNMAVKIISNGLSDEQNAQWDLIDTLGFSNSVSTFKSMFKDFPESMNHTFSSLENAKLQDVQTQNMINKFADEINHFINRESGMANLSSTPSALSTKNQYSVDEEDIDVVQKSSKLKNDSLLLNSSIYEHMFINSTRFFLVVFVALNLF